jgi:hypothetical protein
MNLLEFYYRVVEFYCRIESNFNFLFFKYWGSIVGGVLLSVSTPIGLRNVRLQRLAA